MSKPIVKEYLKGSITNPDPNDPEDADQIYLNTVLKNRLEKNCDWETWELRKKQLEELIKSEWL